MLTTLFAALAMITKLPNELTAKICSFLAKDELAAFRLVDRQTSATATREFAVRYFTTLIIMVSRYSLQALVDICSHPVFGGYVRNITFSAFRVEAGGLSELVTDFESGLDNNSLPEFNEAEKDIQLFLSHCRENIELHNGDGAEYIACAFSRLDERNIPLKIKVDSRPCGDAIGTKRASQFDINGWYETTSLTVRMVLNGASQADCSLESLELLRDADEFDGRSDPISLKDKDAESLRQLKRFTFHQHGVDSDGPHDFASVEQITQRTESLQFLEIGFSSRYNDVDGATTPEAFDFFEMHVVHDLREISLSRMVIPQEELLGKLDECKKTLRKLRLNLIGIRDGTWEHVLTWIYHNLTLQDLELKDLFIPWGPGDYDKVSITDMYFTQALCLHGEQKAWGELTEFLHG